MRLEFRGGLLFTSIAVAFLGKTIIIDNIVIDTGAAESIINPDAVESIGINVRNSESISSFYGAGGDLHHFFSRRVDFIEIDDVRINDIKLDFGVVDLTGEVNGLLGLDFLIKLEAIIDLKNFTLNLRP
jgi:predicted aspartyl protease